jgi:thiol-disulfide isomerase/thioredoxin
MTPSNAPTIYYHYTAWCGYCKKMRPIWDEVKATYGGRAFFIEVDEDVVHTPTVSSYPTVIAHINDTKITYSGGYTEPALAKFVRDAIEIKAKST